MQNYIRRYGLPDSCFVSGFSRAFCCSDSGNRDYCFDGGAFTRETCCLRRDVCHEAYTAVAKHTPFESCSSWFLCAAAIFMPCLVWSLEDDWRFETHIARDLLTGGHTRCFALSLYMESLNKEEPPVIGRDAWFVGFCLPRVCTYEALTGNLRSLFDAVSFTGITGRRLSRVEQAHTVVLEELLHWSQLRLDFALVGPPNSASSTVHKTMMRHPSFRFVTGLDETDLPSWWRRTSENWGWQCTARALVPRRWVQRLRIGVRGPAGARRGRAGWSRGQLLGLRNPKLIFSPLCLEGLASIPGIRIIVMWRDPLDWLWSSLQRCLEGMNTSKDEVQKLWQSLTTFQPGALTDGSHGPVDTSGVALRAKGGGVQELAVWRLGVPLDQSHARVSEQVARLARQLRRRQLILISFRDVVSPSRTAQHRLFSRLYRRLGVRQQWAWAGKRLSHNVRRRRGRHPSAPEGLGRRERPPGLPLSAGLEELYAGEKRAMGQLFAAHGLSKPRG